MIRRCIAASILAILAAFPPNNADAQRFTAHQDWLAALETSPDLDIDDPRAVLMYVLAAFPNPIRVQPTENYAYFTVAYGGLVYQGNIRLETEHGMPNDLHFAHFVQPAPWHDAEIGQYRRFTQEDGLLIRKTGDFRYEISFGGVSRDMILNDISNESPAADFLAENERFLGQVNDESGLRFWLTFDVLAREFAYFLDERPPIAERLVPASTDPALMIGIRTGFVFLPDPGRGTLRLVGVYQDNVARNTYFDGPFDQLPDGYRGDLSVRDALIAIDPSMADEVDTFGNFLKRDGARVVIAPYIRYWHLEDFDLHLVCHDRAIEPGLARYAICLRDAAEAAR